MQNDVKQELGRNFIEYAVAVNSDRAIPDSKSGLKPVARRILWGAFDGGKLSSKPHVKSARIVGDVMGALHPHGDSSIYGALVRLGQDWVMRYPLIDFHGNVGNQAGDGPAAMRYTEARLSKLAEDGMLFGIKKHNVDFMPTYDETSEEPVTLPAIFPNLLCNPNTGIGVAMASSWMCHNLGEVAQAIYDYMDGKEPMLPGPDFPTGGIVINKNDIPAIMRTGRGSVKVRGRYKVEKNKIIFYEIPYGETIEGLLNEISEVCDKKEIEGISEVHDESNKKGLRIVIVCEKGLDPEGIVKKLFAKTNLQTSLSYNQVALIDKTPTDPLSLKQCIEIYLNHNIDCLKREIEFDLNKAKARLHVVEGLLIALANIENVIKLIKNAESSSVAKINLMNTYKLSEVQSKAILDMKLAKLAKLEIEELENEKKSLIQQIAEWEDILQSKDKQINIIRQRLETLVKKYGDSRRTELAQIEVPKEEKEIEEVIPEDVVVIMTQTGEIKRIPRASFRTQRRNGKGVASKEESVLDTISTNTIDTLMFFTTKGKMYRMIVDDVPVGNNTSKGININNLIALEPGEKVIAMTSLYRKTKAKYVVFITKNGLIKKTLLEEYEKTKRNKGIIALSLKEGDAIAEVTFLEEEDLILITKNGMSIHFETAEITAVGRVAQGVKSIKLSEGDEVIAGLPIHKDTDYVGIFTSRGLGKKVLLSELPVQGRVGKGLTIYKPDKATGNIVGVTMISDEDNITLIGKPKSICISAKEIPLLSRTSVGNSMINGSEVISVVKL